jgi:hypothetical protein
VRSGKLSRLIVTAMAPAQDALATRKSMLFFGLSLAHLQRSRGRIPLAQLSFMKKVKREG